MNGCLISKMLIIFWWFDFYNDDNIFFIGFFSLQYSRYKDIIHKITKEPRILWGQCKKMRDLLDAILVFKNKITLQKNTSRFCYIALAMVQPEPDMSWNM